MSAYSAVVKAGSKKRKQLYWLLWIIGMSAVSAVLFTPLVAMLTTAFKSMEEIQTSMALFPRVWHPENFVDAMSAGDWPRYFMNTAIVTVSSVALAMLFNSIAGFAFARLNFPGKNIMFMSMLIGLMMPAQVTLLPTFMIIVNFPFAGGNDLFGQGGTGLMNTYAGLILPLISSSFGVFLSRQYFMNFPTSLDEAAEIDGCNKFQTYFKIYLPISKPLLATLGVLRAVNSWNDYIWPLVVTNRVSMRTVQLGLTKYSTEFGTDWNLLMAATTLVVLPMVLLFLFAQKYFVEGIANAGIKG